MLRIERAGKRLVEFDDLTRKPVGEFYDLTDFVVNSPEAFFGEAGERLFVLGAHVRLAPGERSAVDVLAMDPDGASVAVVMEGGGETSLARAVSAASRLAAWRDEEFFRLLAPKRVRELREFLGPNAAAMNRRQRVLIVGERTDEATLSAAEWLRSRGADIGYIETTMAVDPRGGQEYLRCRAAGPRGAGPGAAAPAASAPPADDSALAPPDEAPHPLDGLFDEPADGPPTERRKNERRVDFEPVNVEIEYAGRRMSAALADYGPDGIGLEMNHPLPIGSTVRVRGSIVRPSGPLAVDALGRFRHCRFGERAFRLGVAFASAGS